MNEINCSIERLEKELKFLTNLILTENDNNSSLISLEKIYNHLNNLKFNQSNNYK